MWSQMRAPDMRVLYVDDEPAMCRAFARMFAHDGSIEIATTNSPQDAIALFARESFDVIVSDLRMPGVDGIQLLSSARRTRPGARRLLVSGFADLETALQAINNVGVDRLLTKPWDTDELVAAVREAGTLATLARDKARVTEELRRKAAELEALNRELDHLVEERTNDLLDGLVCALDARDSETQWHSRRVGRYARRLAVQLGENGRGLDDIERGAMLHDIGKIGVRDAVLRKPGPLDGEEWTEMRRHPVLGYEMLRGISFLDKARLIPLHHQEHWDGGGYPAGLCGEEICLGARVFAVVDAYDAITSNRPYRSARSYEIAREEIVRCAGTQFDPRVVEAWLRVPATEWRSIRVELEGLQADGRAIEVSQSLRPG